jgi:hypothetical protein
MTNRTLHAAQILWPAFLMASILEMLVFAWFDPAQVSIGAWQPSTQTTYSLAFLAFWALIAIASGVSHWMMKANEAHEPERPITRRQSRRQHAHNHL